jgi:hypothetical protein
MPTLFNEGQKLFEPGRHGCPRGWRAGIAYSNLAAYRAPSDCLVYYDGALVFLFRSDSGERFLAFDTSDAVESEAGQQTFLIQSAPEGKETGDFVAGLVPIRQWMLRRGGAFEAKLDHRTKTCLVYWIRSDYITDENAPWDPDLVFNRL